MGLRSKKAEGAQKRRAFMVELKYDMPDTPSVTFFGSKKAIFEYFGNALGISYTTSRTKNFSLEPYENSKCRIFEGYVMSDHCPEIVERRAREGRDEIKNTGSFGATKK